MRAALESITAGELQRHVNVLADDAFEGRGAGSRGGRAAGVYLGQQFRRLGLRGAGDDGGYYQPFGAGYRNILGLLEGSDPLLKKQVVLVGAHYDHVGYGNAGNSNGPIGYIHNGADDNASGVAGLLETAQAMTQFAGRSRRTVLFALWDGEEQGLLGSKHWIARPTLPLERVAIVLNLDMIGRLRNSRVEVLGTRSGYGLRRLVSRQNVEGELRLDFTWELKSNSDHHPFYQRGIPILMPHTGLHEDYHRPTDDAHGVSAAGMQSVSRLLFRIVNELANAQRVTRFRAAGREETPWTAARRFQTLPPPPSRLGLWWNPAAKTNPGLRLTRIAAGSPAERAGLRVGDELVRLDGRPAGDVEAFRMRVLAARRPVKVVVERPGEKTPVTLTVQLAGSPVRLGIAWRMDDAEPGTAVLVQVVPGSPAAVAGLAVHDRIYQFAGRDFATSDDLLKLATETPGPAMLLVEREGRLREVAVRPLE